MSREPASKRCCRRDRYGSKAASWFWGSALLALHSVSANSANAVRKLASPLSTGACLLLIVFLQSTAFAQLPYQREIHALLYDRSDAELPDRSDFRTIHGQWANPSVEWIWLSVFENNRWLLRRVQIDQAPAIDQSYVAPSRITAFCKRGSDEYWLGTSKHGLFHVRDQRLIPVTFEQTPDGSELTLTNTSSVLDICAHSNGKVYVATSAGIYVLDDTEAGTVRASKLSDLVSKSVIEYTDKQLVCMTRKEIKFLDPISGDLESELWLDDNQPSHKPTVIKLSHDGTLWIGTNQGLYLHEADAAHPFRPANRANWLQGKGVIDIAEFPVESQPSDAAPRSRCLFVLTEAGLVRVDCKSKCCSNLQLPVGPARRELLPGLVCSKSDVWVSTSTGVSRCGGATQQAIQMAVDSPLDANNLYLTTDESSTRINLKSNSTESSGYLYRLVSPSDATLSHGWHNASSALDLPTPATGEYQIQVATYDQSLGQSPISTVEYHVAHPSMRWLRNIIVCTTSAACAVFGFMFVTGIIRTNRELERCVEERTAEAVSVHQEKQQLEFSLLHAQKMESLGTMAAGMAHDFNNSLCAITSNAELGLLSLYQSPDRVQKYLQDVLEASHQASDITQSLLTFAGKSPPKKQPGQLQRVVQNSMRMIRSAVPSSIGITAICDEPIWCQLDAAQMNQVIVNLTMNARDAMPNGGDLTIEVFQDITTNDRRNAVLRISDTGKGMDEATMARVFEPFYTTKARGKGTGLGMSMVHSIVTAHDGTINVDSAVDRGTVVELRFPMCQPQARTDASTKVLDQTPKRQLSGTVLIADDEPRVRSSLASVFEMAGLQVITAEDGAQLVENAKNRNGEIVLIATDLDMPGLDGASAVKTIRSTHPNLPAIIFTGQATFPRELDPNITAYLRKPFQLAEILDAARRLAGDSDAQPDT